MPLEILHVSLVFFRSRARFEGAEIAALAGLRIHFSGIEPIFARLQFSDHGTRASCSVPLTLIARPPLAFPRGMPSDGALETKIADEISALVLDRVRAFHTLERLLGVFIAECRGPFVIGLGGAGILRSAASLLGERAHPLHCAGMILRGSFFR